MSATLAEIDAALFAALAPLQCPAGGIVSDARPFALVARWMGDVLRDKGVDPEAVAQYPCAFLAWPGERSSPDDLMLSGDAEDRAVAPWTVYVAVEETRSIDDTVVGATGVPGALTLVDLVVATLNGLLIPGLLRNSRLRYVSSGPYAVKRGAFYVAQVTFQTERCPATVTPADTSVPLVELAGNVNLVETRDGDDPENPVDQFVADTAVAVTLSGTVRGEEGVPLEGVAVSVLDQSGTATTDADGAWSLTAYGARDVTVRYVTVRYVLAGRQTTQTAFTLGTADVSGLYAVCVLTTTWDAVLAAVSVTQDGALGSLITTFDPTPPSPAGFGLNTSPASGTSIALDPASLASMTNADAGVLFVANVTPGDLVAAPFAPPGAVVSLAPHVASLQPVAAGVTTFVPCAWV